MKCDTARNHNRREITCWNIYPLSNFSSPSLLIHILLLLPPPTDIYSSPPSSNYSTSLSDGVVTPISSINDSIKSEGKSHSHTPTQVTSSYQPPTTHQKSCPLQIVNDNPRPVIPEKSTIHVICFNSKYSTPAADRTLLHVDDERKLKYLKTLPSTDGTYSCQFCSKTFPRLGYLKKHEQVRLSLALLLCKSDIIVIFITFREFVILSFGNISKSETLSHSVPSATWLNKIVLAGDYSTQNS